MGALPRASGVIPCEAVQSCRVANCGRAPNLAVMSAHCSTVWCHVASRELEGVRFAQTSGTQGSGFAPCACLCSSALWLYVPTKRNLGIMPPSSASRPHQLS